MTPTQTTGNSACLDPPAAPCAQLGMQSNGLWNYARIAERLASDLSQDRSRTSFRNSILQSLTEHPNLPIIAGGLKLCLWPSIAPNGDTSFLAVIDAQKGILSVCRVKNLKANP